MSPRSRLVTQNRYCSTQGLSRPISRRAASIMSFVTPGWAPYIWTAGSPGERWRTRNTITETKNSTGMAWSSRRRMYRLAPTCLAPATLHHVTGASAMRRHRIAVRRIDQPSARKPARAEQIEIDQRAAPVDDRFGDELASDRAQFEAVATEARRDVESADARHRPEDRLEVGRTIVDSGIAAPQAGRRLAGEAIAEPGHQPQLVLRVGRAVQLDVHVLDSVKG